MSTTPTTSTRAQIIMAHVFCVAQQFTSVTVYVLGKKIMDTVDVYHFVIFRLFFVIPIVLIAAIFLTKGKLAAWKVPKKPWIYIAASGLIGIFISQTMVFKGLEKSTALNASIISAPCTPLFTALFSVLRGSDKMNIPKGFGFLSSIIGALLLLQVWNFEFQGKTMGNLLMVGSTVCNALNSLVQKQVLNDGYHPLVVQFYVCSVGIVAYLVGYSVPSIGLYRPESWEITGTVWIYITIVGVVASAIPWCVSIIALKHTSPLTTSVYVVLQPLIAGFVNVIFMSEVLTWVQLLGGGLVILGLFLVNAQPIVQRLLSRTKAQFELLPTDEKEIELKVITDSTGDDEKSSKEEVKYDLSATGETNAFVIEDGADYIVTSEKSDKQDFKPVDGIFTPEFVRYRHEHEEAEGYNFSVTLHKPADTSADVKEDEADYIEKDGADYHIVEQQPLTSPTSTDFYTSTCREKDIPDPPSLTLRPIV